MLRPLVPTPSRLTQAISENSITELKNLLELGDKLRIENLWHAFIPNAQEILPKILDLLETYQALPEDVSMSTIKYILSLEANKYIDSLEVSQKPDINLNGCVGLPSPMEVAVRSGLIETVKFLVIAGVKERPIATIFNVQEAHFDGLDFLNINQYKEKILRYLEDPNEKLSSRIIAGCSILELFLAHPTDELFKSVDKILTSPHTLFKLLPFFAWAAKNNHADLFNIECFTKLFVKNPKIKAISLHIAIVFGATDYVKNVIRLIGENSIQPAMTIAIAAGDQEMLICIMQILKDLGLSIKDFSHPTLSNNDPFLSLMKASFSGPLYWAVYSENIKAVAYLLAEGLDPNSYFDSYLKQNVLFLAVRVKNIEIVKLLLQHGIQPDQKDRLEETPLFKAVKEKSWGIAYLLVKEYNADIQTINEAKTALLDLVEDEEIKKTLIDLSERVKNNKPAVSIIYQSSSPLLGFLSTLNEDESIFTEAEKITIPRMRPS